MHSRWQLVGLLRRDEHHEDGGVLCHDPPGYLDPVDLRHVHVDQGQVRLGCVNHRERLFGARYLARGLEAGGGHDDAPGRGQERSVVIYGQRQNRAGACSLSHPVIP